MRSDLCISALVVAATMLAGCAASRTVLVDSAAARFSEPEQEFDFWDTLATQRVVTNQDAIYGLLLTAGDEVPDDYASRWQAARGRGWLAGDAAPPPGESATVGMIAVATCELIGTEGGLVMRLLGPAPRSCTREIIYLDLIPPRSENQSLSGLEFIDLLSRIEAHNRKQESS